MTPAELIKAVDVLQTEREAIRADLAQLARKRSQCGVGKPDYYSSHIERLHEREVRLSVAIEIGTQDICKLIEDETPTPQ